MEHNEESVIALVKKFKLKTLGNEPKDYMCFTVCYPLSEHLKNNNILHSFAMGKVNGVAHYWLRYSDFLIDLTPDQKQFKHSTPISSPYIVKLPLDKLPPAYTDEHIIELNDVIEQWSEPLLNSIYKIESKYPTDPKSIQLLIRMTPVYLQFLVKAAIVLLSDTEQQDSNVQFLGNLYTACYGYNIDKIKTLFDELPEGWEIFEARFIDWKHLHTLI